MIMKHVFDVLQKDKTPEDYEEFPDKELWLEKEIVVCNVQFILKLSSANFLADINCLNDFCVIYIQPSDTMILSRAEMAQTCQKHCTSSATST